MVSNAKRLRYVYENEVTTSEESNDSDYALNDKFQVKSQSPQRSGRKPKCFSKNALMARENRLKKKMYISRLENDVSCLKNENKKLATVLDNQSSLIAELKKEISYLKSVLANSTDISNLIRNIHQSTGMSVSSSLDKNLSLKNVCVPKLPIARKTAHPWEENEQYPSYPTPESNYFSSPDEGNTDTFFSDIPEVLPIDFLNDDIFDNLTFTTESTPVFNEHNYTSKSEDNLEEDVGVCLHVSNHRVSLEFCSTCNENASQSRLT